MFRQVLQKQTTVHMRSNTINCILSSDSVTLVSATEGLPCCSYYGVVEYVRLRRASTRAYVSRRVARPVQREVDVGCFRRLLPKFFFEF